MEGIYLDHAATSPIHPEVMAVMQESMQRDFGNPSSTHQYGRLARQAYNQALDTLAQSINAQPSEIIMTSCGTESDNMAIFGAAKAKSHKGKHIISTEIEHPGVMKALKALEDEGFEVTYLAVDGQGRMDMDSFKEALREDTILVTIMAVNNEIGNTNPIESIGRHLKQVQSQALFHTDAVQAYGLMDIDVEAMGLDLLSVSSHKVNGPKGIGFLYQRTGVNLPPMIVGGGQEQGYRAGTENVPAMAGFAKAVEIMKEGQADKRQRLLAFADQLLAGLDACAIPYTINGDRKQTIGHVLNVHLHGVDASRLLVQLDLQGIAVSAGSACSAGKVDPSLVLLALYGPDHDAISQSIRFSFGLGTTAADIDRLIHTLDQLINKE